jgi:hypothetical protein
LVGGFKKQFVVARNKFNLKHIQSAGTFERSLAAIVRAQYFSLTENKG